MRGCHLRHPRVVLEDARDQVLRAAVHPLEQQRGVCVQQLRLHEDVVVRLTDGEERGASACVSSPCPPPSSFGASAP